MYYSSLCITLSALLAVALGAAWTASAASAEPKPPDLMFPISVGAPEKQVQTFPAVVRTTLLGEDKPVYLLDEPEDSFFTQTQYWTQNGRVNAVIGLRQTDAQSLNENILALLRAAVRKWGKDFFVASSTTFVNQQERLAVSLIWRQESQLVWVSYTPTVGDEQGGSLIVRIRSDPARGAVNGIGLSVQKLDPTVHDKNLTQLRQVVREEKVQLKFYDPTEHGPGTPKAESEGASLELSPGETYELIPER